MAVKLVASVKKSDLEREYTEQVVEKFLNPLIIRINDVLSDKKRGYPAQSSVQMDLDVLARQLKLDMNLLDESTKAKIIEHFSKEFNVEESSQYKHRLKFS